MNILDEVYEYLGRYIVYPNDHARVLHTLWIVHTHLIDAFDYTPRLCILSAEKRSGKSTLLKLTKVLSQSGSAFVNPTPASLYSIIEETQNTEDPMLPTLCIDEQDRLWSRKETGEIIAILDQGFERDNDGVPRVRIDRNGTRHIDRFNTFCPVLLAGIETSSMPDTILDRSLVIRMKRRHSGEPVKRYRTRDKTEAIELRDKIAEWAKSVIDEAKTVIPEIPSYIDDRLADISEPLLIVTNVTNVTEKEKWVEWLLIALKSYNTQRSDEEPSHNMNLLKDIKEFFEYNISDRITKKSLVEDILKVHNNTFNQFRRKLDIPKDHAIRISGDKEPHKGWYKKEWDDVFNRYLPQTVTMVTMDTFEEMETEDESLV